MDGNKAGYRLLPAEIQKVRNHARFNSGTFE